MNYNGLNLELEKQHQDGTEYQFGVTSPQPLFIIPYDERVKYLPIGEIQRGKDDTMDCATRAPMNLLETLLTYAVQKNKLSYGNIRWLKDKGYVTLNNRVVLSDAFNAILSGTTRSGNSLKKPIDSIRKDGCIPKRMLPLEKWMTFEDYHNKDRINDTMIALGKEFAERFTIYYEQIPDVMSTPVNNTEMLVDAGYAWSEPVNGIYPRVDYKPNHAFLRIQPEHFIFDNYEESKDDFIKQLAPDYAFYDYAYRLYIIAENPKPTVTQESVLKEKISLMKIIIGLMQQLGLLTQKKTV